MFDVSDEHKQDRAYFAPLYDEIAKGGLAAMLADLLAMPLQGWHPRAVPKTDALRDQQIQSLDPFDGWWLGRLQAGELPGTIDDTKPYIALSCELLQSVKDSSRQALHFTDHLLGRRLRKVGCQSAPRSAAGRAWLFPALAAAREEWSRRFPG